MKRILVGDGDDAVLELLDFMLNKDGFVTRTIHDCQHFNEHISDFEPHILLLDDMLGGRKTTELCEPIWSSTTWRKIPVFLFANESTGSRKIDNITAYIKKPFDITELLKLLNDTLQK